MNANLVSGIVSVCAWCYPGDTIFAVRPEWRELGLTISHGICKTCLEMELESVKQRNKMNTSETAYITVRVKTENYGKGCPGYNTEVTLWDGDTRIARAFGPNVNGWCIGEFRDRAAVRTAQAWGDGAKVEAETALALLWKWHAEKARARRANS